MIRRAEETKKTLECATGFFTTLSGQRTAQVVGPRELFRGVFREFFCKILVAHCGRVAN